MITTGNSELYTYSALENYIALLTLLTVVIWATSALLYLKARLALPFEMASAAGCLLTISVFSGWVRFGRDVVSLGNLLMAVAYALWKVPLYVKFLAARQIDWVRSKRDQERAS